MNIHKTLSRSLWGGAKWKYWKQRHLGKMHTERVLGMTSYCEDPFTLCYICQGTSPKKRCGNWGDGLARKVSAKEE